MAPVVDSSSNQAPLRFSPVTSRLCRPVGRGEPRSSNRAVLYLKEIFWVIWVASIRGWVVTKKRDSRTPSENGSGQKKTHLTVSIFKNKKFVLRHFREWSSAFDTPMLSTCVEGAASGLLCCCHGNRTEQEGRQPLHPLLGTGGTGGQGGMGPCVIDQQMSWSAPSIILLQSFPQYRSRFPKRGKKNPWDN